MKPIIPTIDWKEVRKFALAITIGGLAGYILPDWTTYTVAGFIICWIVLSLCFPKSR